MQRAQPWISIKSIPVSRALRHAERRAARKQAWYIYLGMYRYHVVMDYCYTLTLLWMVLDTDQSIYIRQ